MTDSSLIIIDAIIARIVEGGLFILIMSVFLVTSWCLFFKKMGNKRYEALIPYHSFYILITNSWKPGRWVFSTILLAILPFIELIFGETLSLIVWAILGILLLFIWISVNLGLAKKFGKGTWFGVGLILLPFIFYPILAWGKAKYKKTTRK